MFKQGLAINKTVKVMCSFSGIQNNTFTTTTTRQTPNTSMGPSTQVDHFVYPLVLQVTQFVWDINCKHYICYFAKYDKKIWKTSTQNLLCNLDFYSMVAECPNYDTAKWILVPGLCICNLFCMFASRGLHV